MLSFPDGTKIRIIGLNGILVDLYSKGGAIPGKVFLDMLNEAGFANVELVGETGLNSSPVTKGVLFGAIKPTISEVEAPEEHLTGGHLSA